jgi:hypothetical protein
MPGVLDPQLQALDKGCIMNSLCLGYYEQLCADEYWYTKRKDAGCN